MWYLRMHLVFAFCCASLGAVAGQSDSTEGRLLAPELFVEGYRAARTSGALLLDCRTPAEFAQGSLPGARNVDLRDPTFRARVDSLDHGEDVYIFCQSGGRSARAASVLGELGFRQVFDLQGGYGNLPPALLLED